MGDVWLVVVVVGAATIALKSAGPLLLGPAVLAALVVTQVVGGDHRWVFDARLVGIAAAAVALALRAPILLTVVVAAAATAIVRLVS